MGTLVGVGAGSALTEVLVLAEAFGVPDPVADDDALSTGALSVGVGVGVGVWVA